MPHPVLIVQHEDDAPPGQIAAALGAHGLDVDPRRADRGDEVPVSPAGFGGVVVLGGFMGARDDDEFPWLPRVRELLAATAHSDVPGLGLCLGAQLAATALGGTVARRPGGYEIAWTPVRAGEAALGDPVAGALGQDARLLLWHQDAFVAPPGATPLFTGGQAFRLGSLWAFQHHPEVDEVVVGLWCDDPSGPAQLAHAGTTRADVLAGARDFAPHGRRLLDAWCAVVAGLDVGAGAVASTG